MTEIATIDWFGRWGTSVFSENTTIFNLQSIIKALIKALCGAVVEWLERSAMVRKVAGTSLARSSLKPLTVHPAANEYLFTFRECY